MAHIAEHIIEQVTQEVCQARLMNPDTRNFTKALEILADDHGIKGEDAKRVARVVNFRAVKLWNQWGREAGVPEKFLF